MSLFRPRKPSKPGARMSIWEMLFNGNGLFGDDSNGKWLYKNGVYFYKPTYPPSSSGGGSGWDWMYPTHKELDPTLLYTKGKLAFLSPMNPLVVTGLTDIILGSNVMAGAGTWLCVKNVPAAVTGSYNVPQIPYPGATGTPAGTPLKGDIDGSNVFWVLVTPIC